jgi:hypothetical protein
VCALLGLLSAALLCLTSSALAATVNVRDYGARGNGVHDDTAAVLKALEVAERRGAVVRFPAGTYLVGVVRLPAGVGLDGDGAGSTWLRGSITANSSSRVSDLRLGAPGYAFHFATGTHDTTFLRCRFVGGGGMTAGANQGVIRFDAHSARDVTFTACVVGRNAADGNGVSIAETARGHYEDILFRDCRFRGQPRMNFECIQRGGEGYRAIDLIDCVFDASDSQSVSYGGGGYSRVEGCVFLGAGKRESARWPHDFEINGSRGMTVTGNVFHSARGSMLNLNGIADGAAEPGASVTVSGSTFVSDKGIAHAATACWAMVGRSGVLVRDNEFRVGGASEVFYVHGAGNAFIDNRISFVSGSRGKSVFFLEEAPGTVASGNMVRAAGSNVTVRRRSGGSVFSDNVFITGNTAGEFFRIEKGLSVSISGNTYE